MPLDVFLFVLAAALLHATWNAMLKSGSGDRPGVIKGFCATQVGPSLCLAPFVEFPAAAAWPYLIASTLISTAMWLMLNRAYQTSELSLVYPLARGTGPLVVALLSSLLFDETLSRTALIGVLLIALGIISLALTRGAAGLRDMRAVALALAMGGLIGAYSVLDALGVRAAGSASSYIVWVVMLGSALGFVAPYWLHPASSQATGGHFLKTHFLKTGGLRAGILSGLIAYLCSAIVLWAYTQAPIALVSALRETSIIFAVILGVVFLKEQLSLARLAAIATALVGTAILKVSR
jgi:drug/metabolite transporter (DMT)-like permease